MGGQARHECCCVHRALAVGLKLNNLQSTIRAIEQKPLGILTFIDRRDTGGKYSYWAVGYNTAGRSLWGRSLYTTEINNHRVF